MIRTGNRVSAAMLNEKGNGMERLQLGDGSAVRLVACAGAGIVRLDEHAIEGSAQIGLHGGGLIPDTTPRCLLCLELRLVT
jgi:hypothetical protein